MKYLVFMVSFILTFVFLLGDYSTTIAIEYNDRTNGVTTEIEKNEWQPYHYDEVDTLIALWEGEYSTINSCYFKASFYNSKTKTYKLVAPWMKAQYICWPNSDNVLFKKKVSWKEYIKEWSKSKLEW